MLPNSAPTSNAASLLLRAGGERHLVAGSPGCEVARCAAPATLPHAPPWLLGVVVHKGEALALVDLALALESQQAGPAPEQGRMLVTRGAGCAIAYLVDDVDAAAGAGGAAPLDLDALGRRLLAAAAARGA